MHSFLEILSSIPLHWRTLSAAGVLGIIAICVHALQSDSSRAKRARSRKEKELRALADRISRYAQTVRQRFPTGDVVVSEGDLAEELRKRPDSVVTALNLLLKEQKVERTQLGGYWRLNA